MIYHGANLLHHNPNDMYSDPVKWHEAYHPETELAAAKQLPERA